MLETYSIVEKSSQELKDIHFPLPKFANGSVINHSIADRPHQFTASFKRQPIDVVVKNRSSFNKEGQCTYVEIGILIFKKGEDSISAKITLSICREMDGSYEARTSVINYESSENAQLSTKIQSQLTGVGRELWEISLPIIQECANNLAAPIVHTVKKEPGLGLTTDKWGALMLPLIKKHEYDHTEGTVFWKKTYYPQR